MSVDLLMTGLIQGLILACVAYGVMIPFRLLHLSDLSVDGVYPLAGTVCAVGLNAGYHPCLALMLGMLSGGVLNVCTGLLYVRLRINILLAGIILSFMVYSINLRLLEKPNIPLFHVTGFVQEASGMMIVGILLSLVMLIYAGLSLFLHTDFGLRLRAVGLNSAFARTQGISIVHYTLLGLFLAGCCSGLAGGAMVHVQHYMDVSMGVGVVIHGLAALMIGEKIVGTKTINQQLLAPFVGALTYQQIQGLVLMLGLSPVDLKLFTGLIVLMLLLPQGQKKQDIR